MFSSYGEDIQQIISGDIIACDGRTSKIMSKPDFEIEINPNRLEFNWETVQEQIKEQL